jgi:hypothetical protein
MKTQIKGVIYGLLLTGAMWAFSLTPMGHDLAVGLGLAQPEQHFIQLVPVH